MINKKNILNRYMSYIFLSILEPFSYFTLSKNSDEEIIEYEIIDSKDLEKECYLCKTYKHKNDFSNRQYKKKFRPRCKSCLK